MNKVLRKAVRCYLIKDNKVVAIKYNKGNKKAGYYDIPGGKIEENELPKQTVIREMKEETGIDVKSLQHKGVMKIEYPDRIFLFEIFFSNEYSGEPKIVEENTSQWIDIDDLLREEKILSNIIVLNKFFIKGLIDDNCKFSMSIIVDEQENILSLKYDISEI